VHSIFPVGKLRNRCGIITPVTNPKQPEDLSEGELRRLLLDKRRDSRQRRLERFRQTGRAVRLAPDLPEAAFDEWHSQPPTEGDQGTPGKPARHSLKKRWFDRLLLVVEMLAILGLAGILVNGFGLLRTLNQEVVVALKQETPTATPLITAVVLPGGHTPPSTSGGSQFNESEIPEHLRPLVQSLANLPVPTQGPQQAIQIDIPALDILNWPIVQGDAWEQLKKGVGQHAGSANPGENGNVVLAGHDDVFGEVFRDLDKLQPGDKVILYTMQQQYTYFVTETRIVEPSQVDVMDQTSTPTVTLISCYPYMVDNKRIVVFATLQNP
jgi:sortase A